MALISLLWLLYWHYKALSAPSHDDGDCVAHQYLRTRRLSSPVYNLHFSVTIALYKLHTATTIVSSTITRRFDPVRLLSAIILPSYNIRCTTHDDDDDHDIRHI
ncbi:hypothetical protein KFK09_021206 [Dendrobium nobile]|uniref:Secreted protein n=1 Tax=Dendrobium nobile TaxID=94219 RepID=A0A8T3AV70_DENNO|nr:hypothetical protein KFK09_021206 [Dendrobium nobile]